MTPTARHATFATVLLTARLAFAQAEVHVPDAIFTDPALPADVHYVKIVPNPEGSLPDVSVARRSASHYTIRSTQAANTGGYYVLLKLDGVAGRMIQLDFDGPPFEKWGNSVPSFSEATDVAKLDSFDVENGPPNEARSAGVDGPELPDTTSQAWHYASESWHEGTRICARFRFEKDGALVAFKVPYLPAYDAAFLATLHESPVVKIETVGTSRGGRPLNVVVIAKDRAPDAPPRPCTLIYAREHPDDQDGSWIAQGAIQALAADTDAARAMREQSDFLIIPMFDPDGAIAASHGNVIASFIPGRTTPESAAYMAWFDRWLASGHRVDVAISLHGAPPGAAFHLACPLMEPDRLTPCEQLHNQVRGRLLAQQFTVRNTPWAKGKSLPVLSGWLQDRYGTLVLPYVANSLTAKSQLNLAQLRQLGATIATASAAFLDSPDGKLLIGRVDVARAAAATRPAATQPRE